MNERGARLISMQRLAGAMVKLLFAAVYCWGLSRLILDLSGLPSNPLLHGLAILTMMLLLAGLTWQRYNLLAFGGIWLLVLLLAVILREKLNDPAVEAAIWFRNWLAWVSNYFMTGSSEGTLGTLDGLSLVICLLLAVACYLGMARFNWSVLAMTALLLVAGAHELFISGGWQWAILAGLSVIAASARNQKHAYQGLDWIKYPAQSHFMLESLPLAAVALALALAASSLWPAAVWQNPALALRLDVLRSELGFLDNGFLPTSGEIYEFSIGSAGYYPLGDRLGGPVLLSDTPVMTVSGYTDGMLLRGAISATYTGQRWLQGEDVKLHNFNSEEFLSLRTQVFDQQRPILPVSSLDLPWLSEISYKITPANQSQSTIFISGRPVSFSVDGLNPDIYFNSSGLLFIQPALNANQSLQVVTKFADTEFPAFANDADSISSYMIDAEQAAYREISDKYLQTPDYEEYQENGTLAVLVSEIVDESLTPWEQARQLKDYLTQNCTYNLRVKPPPAQRDFVSYFIETKEGYCVYFATAMTMMCRLAGIPARYVEGYTVPPGETETEERLVTGLNAHAWTEVFLAGVGWVPIDATAGSAPSTPDTSPTPTFNPGKPTPDGSNPGDPTPTRNPLTPTGGADVTPGANRVDRIVKDFFKWLGGLSPWWLLLLLLIPVIYLPLAIVRYKRRYTAAWLTHHFPDARRRVVYCWADMLAMLRMLGIRRQIWETPRMLIERTLEQSTWLSGRRPVVEKMLSGVEKSIFSEDSPEADEIEAITSLRVILDKTLQQNSSRLLFLLRRICYHKQKQDVNDQHANQ